MLPPSPPRLLRCQTKCTTHRFPVWQTHREPGNQLGCVLCSRTHSKASPAVQYELQLSVAHPLPNSNKTVTMSSQAVAQHHLLKCKSLMERLSSETWGQTQQPVFLYGALCSGKRRAVGRLRKEMTPKCIKKNKELNGFQFYQHMIRDMCSTCVWHVE